MTIIATPSSQSNQGSASGECAGVSKEAERESVMLRRKSTTKPAVGDDQVESRNNGKITWNLPISYSAVLRVR